MGAVRTTAKWALLAFLLLPVLVIVAWVVSRAMYPTADQREAIALMEQQPDFRGRNAFPLLWTLERDVPDSELDNVVAEDARRLAQLPLTPDPVDGKAWQFESVAEAYPDLSLTDEDRGLFCNSGTKDCLAQVREDLDTYIALIDRNRAFLDRIDKLHDYDYIRFQFPSRMSTPYPAFQNVFPPRTEHAVLFAQGQTQEALAATCREIVTWRRLGKNSDNMLSRMIGVASTTDHNGQMLATMLAELPVSTPLPEPCDQALMASTIDDISMCNAMRGEFAVMAGSLKDLPMAMDQESIFQQLSRVVLLDVEATVGMTAESYRPVCSQSEREHLATDEREAPESFHDDMWRFACIGNIMGCKLFSIPPNYSSYRHRLQDYGAKLRVLGTLAWMRSNVEEGSSAAELLAARPDELKSPARDIEFGPEGKTLQVPLYDDRRGDSWSIPLPPALYSDIE